MTPRSSITHSALPKMALRRASKDGCCGNSPRRYASGSKLMSTLPRSNTTFLIMSLASLNCTSFFAFLLLYSFPFILRSFAIAERLGYDDNGVPYFGWIAIIRELCYDKHRQTPNMQVVGDPVSGVNLESKRGDLGVLTRQL